MLTLAPAVGVRPILVLAIGNPSRGDDALGPLLAEKIAALELSDVEVQCAYQLQVENALDLIGRREVVFVDATASGPAPYAFSPLQALADESFTTHALSPGTVLDCYRRLTGAPSPRAQVLAIRGYAFELGAPLGAEAAAHLDAAVTELRSRLVDGTP